MKAIVCTQYGPPDAMSIQEVLKPIPKPKEVLIRIHAATVTAGDCEIRKFNIPWLFWLPMRLLLGVRKPRIGIFGQELSGVVEAVGSRVSQFKIGDPVFAPTTMHLGAYAQYICLHESYPNLFSTETITFGAAATIPTGGMNGLHFVQKANILPGEKVLINGAGGSIGTYAVQLAKARGAVVTGVDSSPNLPTLTSLGADYVIDYAHTDFTNNGETYDVIIDVVGKSSFSRCVLSLNDGGRYVLGNPTLSGMLRGLWTSWVSSKEIISAIASYKKEDFVFLREQIESGQLKPVIDKVYPLEKLADAHRYVDAGLKAGNLVIMVLPDN